MSLHEYRTSREIATHDYPFYALIMAAMRKADNFNIERLRSAFPAVYDELYERYNAPGGLLPGETHLAVTEVSRIGIEQDEMGADNE